MSRPYLRWLTAGAFLSALVLLILGLHGMPWTAAPAPDPISGPLEREIEYGRNLFSHTARYLGPKGTVARLMRTHMNCQNCHLDGGRKAYGIGLSSVTALYPAYRAREGMVLTLADRINDCLERPMNSAPLPVDGREMKAILAYFYSLARGTPIGTRRKGDELNDLVEFPSHAASSPSGGKIFTQRCAACHGTDGRGKLDEAGIEFVYPPLWGPESYNVSSNMHRITKLAAFIRANMPLGATWENPGLTNEEAYDVAAFINDDRLHARPPSRWNDYPTIAEKPIDFPRGPYADSFSEERHRLGPFLAMIRSLRQAGFPVYY